MLRSTGIDKGSTQPTIKARCGLQRPHRASDPFPADFTGWEREVTCPACQLDRVEFLSIRAANAAMVLTAAVAMVVVARLAADSGLL